ncbi:MAG: HD-GYP domain-containing protein [Thermovenabulum sp.]|uniref:HD-GYP domain-containing protein n=1 Tax=Thermovenabulum sp. TaxID=3100335 RepID=UPI003C7D0D08
MKAEKKEKDKFLLELIAALALMMDLDENKKIFHAWRVALLSERMARQILPEYKAHIFYAGLLHDIGAISLPEHVVHYTNIKEHFKNPVIFNHPIKGAEIVKEIKPLKIASKMIEHHHENWDGTGYPKGIGGNSINIGGQILRAADTVDILLRETESKNLQVLTHKLEKRRNKEFSDLIFELTAFILKEGDFYLKISEEKDISPLFMEALQSLPSLDTDECGGDAGDVIRVFGKVIDAKHKYTAGHSERVAFYSEKIARGFGLSHKEVSGLKIASYLHDAGKVAVPRYILDKPGRLTEEEFKIMKMHPVYTGDIMSIVGALRDVIPISINHHEKYDGSGYPHGLYKEEIPLGARIMAIADAFDAMTSERPYQKIKNPWEAKGEILKNAGKQFDPLIAKEAVKLL